MKRTLSFIALGAILSTQALAMDNSNTSSSSVIQKISKACSDSKNSADYLFDKIDANHNGQIDKKEWIAIFNSIDKNHNNKIDFQDFNGYGDSTVWSALSSKVKHLYITKKEWLNVFDVIDKNKPKGSISKTEFENFIAKLCKKVKQ